MSTLTHSAVTSDESSRWALGSAAVGALLWGLAPLVTKLGFVSLEHVFLVLPMIATPLAIALLDSLSGGARVYREVLRVQPVASAMALASFALPKGPPAGALTLGWMAMAVTLAIFGIRAQRAAPCNPARSRMSACVAHVFLVLGTAWLLLSRLGIEPGHLTPLRVVLATVHFHASGFMLQVLLAATGAALSLTAERSTTAHRRLAIAAIAAIPCHVFGRVFEVQAPISLGVVLVVAASIGLAYTQLTIARASADRTARAFLFVSSVSLAAAMLVATAYGIGETLGRPILDIGRMTRIHGLLNAVGAITCGLLGHILHRARSAGCRAR